MFIYTTKFSKRKAITGIIILAVILTIIIILAGIGSKTKAASVPTLSATVKDNEQRVQYLSSLGWEVESDVLEQQDITIPKEFNEIYKQYNSLQQQQGFDLLDYAGMEATRYTYQVLNYPDYDDTVVADIIVYNNMVIGGDIQATAMDGFMSGLEFPQ
jgi:hypothetical protein